MVRTLARTIWFSTKWIVALTVLTVAAGAVYLHYSLNELARREIEQHLSATFTNLDVTISNADLVEGEGIRLKNVQARMNDTEHQGEQLFRCDEIFVHCETDWKTLLLGKPKISRLEIHQPVLFVCAEHDGKLNVEKLQLAAGEKHDTPSQIRIHGGRIEYANRSTVPASDPSLPTNHLTLSSLTATAKRVGIEPRGNNTLVMPKKKVLGNHKQIDHYPRLAIRQINATLEPAKEKDCFTVSTTFLGDDVGTVGLSGTVNSKTGAFALAVEAHRIEVTPHLYDMVPAKYRKQLAILEKFTGELEVRKKWVSYDPTAKEKLRFEISGAVAKGRIVDEQLQHEIRQIQGEFHITDKQVLLSNFGAVAGLAKLKFSFFQQGFEMSSPKKVYVEASNLDIPAEPPSFLPAQMVEEWRSYAISGQLSAKVNASFDGTTWTTDLRADADQLSLSPPQFPYRLEKGKAWMEMKNNQMRFGMRAFASQAPVFVGGIITDPLKGKEGWTGDVWVQAGKALKTKKSEGVTQVSYSPNATNSLDSLNENGLAGREKNIPIDRKFIDALPTKVQEYLDAMSLTGEFSSLQFKLSQKEPGQDPQQDFCLTLENGTVCHKDFPYPIRNLRSNYVQSGKSWSFKAIGNNGTGKLFLQGGSTPLPANPNQANGANLSPGWHFTMSVQGKNILLEDELRNALNPEFQKTWDGMNPQGTVDLEAKMDFVKQPGQPRANKEADSILVKIRPHANNSSICPKSWPYKIEDLSGEVSFENGKMSAPSVRGKNGDVTFEAKLTGEFPKNEPYRISLENISVEQIRFNKEMLDAMPLRLRRICKAIIPVQSTGLCYLRGNVEFCDQADNSEEDAVAYASTNLQHSDLYSSPYPQIRWNLTLGMHRFNLADVYRTKNIFGKIQLNGEMIGTETFTSGELEIDSVHCKGVQLTNVRGPFRVDDTVLHFGSHTPVRFRDSNSQLRGQSPQKLAQNGRPVMFPAGALFPKVPTRVLPAPQIGNSEAQQVNNKIVRRSVTASLFDGTARLDGWTYVNEKQDFNVNIKAQGVDLKKASNEIKDIKGELVGNAEMDLRLKGKRNNSATWSGDGKLKILNADLYDVPVVLSLRRMFNLAPNKEREEKRSISSAEMTFYVNSSKLGFPENSIHFISDSIRLVGKGYIDFDRNLDLVFSARIENGGWTNILSLKKLINSTSKRLVQISVGGKVEAPQIRGEPLPITQDVAEGIQRDFEWMAMPLEKK